MFNKIAIGLVLLGSVAFLPAKELKYPVSAIPPSLKENAHTVMRLYQQELEIKSEKLATVSITEVRTILNKNGEYNVNFMELYDPMNKIINLRGKVYDATGKQVRSFGSEDVVDRSYISNSSMYDDNRVKIIDSKYLTYPFTVEYTYEIEMKQTLFLPSWSHGNENTSYENSTFVVKTPAGYVLRYKEYNLPKEVVKSNLDEKKVYTWTLSNIPARTGEPMSSVTSPNYPLLLLAPNKFEVADSKGSSESWKELGIWATSLIDTKDKLPESTILKLKELTATCKNDYEKVKLVYEFMQQKTRYVSIQVGIGGWQPFDAETVDKYSYGDCKALSNYTKALLAAVGIKSYYTLVKAGTGSNKIDALFPSSQFNHVIVCVPIEKDTLWLECTNQRMPCGYNGDFTDDRDVLLIDGENSKLVRTRIYQASENCINRTSTVQLDQDISGTAVVKTNYIGLSYDDIMPIYYADNADKLKIVTQRIELPSFTLSNFSYKENRGRTPSFEENLNLSVRNYIRKLVGDVALLPLNFMNKLTSIPDKVRNRKSDMCIRRPYMENDTVVFHLPKGYKVTELPEKSEIKNEFGKYFATSSLNGDSIIYIRHFELFKGVFPATAYLGFREFLEQVSTADQAVASLKMQ